jgi:hypothetical protein
VHPREALRDLATPWSAGLCPTGRAWADVATATDTAHAQAICSARGQCDHRRGQCVCDALFEGKSCQRMRCPLDCSGHGECVHMQNAAAEAGSYPGLYRYSQHWDAKMIHGCKCDQGWGGFDCSQRICPRGDDPMTGGQTRPEMLLRCSYSPTDPSVVFRLSMNGQLSRVIRASASAADLRNAIESIPGIGTVGVVIESVTGTVPTICDDSNGNGLATAVVRMGFMHIQGRAPVLMLHHEDGRILDGMLSNKIVLASGGESLNRDGDTTVFISTDGTVENRECSGRGLCLETGDCQCFPGFGSSDYNGGVGRTNNCGHVINGESSVTACPGGRGGLPVCSGHGTCSGSPQWQCTCDEGFYGGDCSHRSCPTGRAWFDQPTTADDRAHAEVECSNMGLCDRLTGMCKCREGFSGAACQQMDCPSTQETVADTTFPLRRTSRTVVCSGHGQCLSMRQLAHNHYANGVPSPQTYGGVANDPATWDADQLRGCLCDEGWMGHDCSTRMCPFGNDPSNDHMVGQEQQAELQSLVCTELTGPSTLELTFRGFTTRAISSSASAADVKAELEALDSIGRVDVSFLSGATQACSGGGTTMTVQFRTEHGDLPPITATSADVAAVTIAASATEERQGNTESIECNGRGVCDRETGACKCFPGWSASDGEGNEGLGADCGHQNIYLPVDRGVVFPELT